MTLNGIMAFMLHYFSKFGNFGTNYVKLVEVRPILFVENLVQKI